ncbi:MAG: hypothetical protein RhofKO_34010 [Rhodothermales bacterium]
MERAIHDEVNRVRQARGLRPYRWSTSLNVLARLHSEDMGRRDYFAHVNPEGEAPKDRADRLGLVAQRNSGRSMNYGIGENLFYTHRYHRIRTVTDANGTRQSIDWKTVDDLANEAVQGWMKSPGHRANLLDADFREHALGVAFDQDNRVFVTQNLATDPMGSGNM